MSHSSTTLLVCGRFQPFHNGHLEFLTHAAKKHEGHIILGLIINSTFSSSMKQEDPLGAQGDLAQNPEKNPFSVFERLSLINNIVSHTPLFQRTIVTAFPRPELYWELVEGICPGKRIWALPDNPDSFDKKKLVFYQSKGDQILLVPGGQNKSGTDIRRMAQSDPQALRRYLPRQSFELVMHNRSRFEND